MAEHIDDMITLDPAEAFEFTGGEAIAQFYDRADHVRAGQTWATSGACRRELDRSDDGQTITLKIRKGQVPLRQPARRQTSRTACGA